MEMRTGSPSMMRLSCRQLQVAWRMLMGWLRSLDGAHYIARWRGVPIDLRFNSFLGSILVASIQRVRNSIRPRRAKASSPHHAAILAVGTAATFDRRLSNLPTTPDILFWHRADDLWRGFLLSWVPLTV